MPLRRTWRKRRSTSKRGERRSDFELLDGRKESEPLHDRSTRQQNAEEVFGVVKAYARQELLTPLVGVPRWLALGLLGSVGVMTGGILLLLALLRALQTETGTAFSGNLSWVPYAISAATLMSLIALLLRQINRRSLS